VHIDPKLCPITPRGRKLTYVALWPQET